MNVNNIIGAGLKDAKIRNSDGDLFDVYGVVTATGEPEKDEIEVKGDDKLLGIFVTGQKETFTLEANGLTFDIIQEITGNDVSSSATGSEIVLGTESENNPPIVEVQAFTTAKSADGTECVIKKTWYKVQFSNIKVEQAGENEFKLTCEAIAYQTEEDVTGEKLDSECIAKLQVDSGH
jgi:hypothetical protein